MKINLNNGTIEILADGPHDDWPRLDRRRCLKITRSNADDPRHHAGQQRSKFLYNSKYLNMEVADITVANTFRRTGRSNNSRRCHAVAISKRWNLRAPLKHLDLRQVVFPEAPVQRATL